MPFSGSCPTFYRRIVELSSNNIIPIVPPTGVAPDAEAGISPAMGASKDESFWIEVGRRLSILEHAVGLSGAEIARQIRVTGQAWSHYTKGERSLPVPEAIKLKEIFGCSLEWIFTGSEATNLPVFQDKLVASRRIKPKPKRGRRPKAASRKPLDGWHYD